MDEHARQRREEQIPATRRHELDKRARQLAKELPELELRYLRDVLASKLATSKGGRPAIDREQLRRDAQKLNRDVDALAKKWGTSRETARKRLASIGK
jgi:predicted transcriptional regulator